MKKLNLSSQSGMSLIEVMVASTISMVIMLAVANSLVDSQKAQKSIALTQDTLFFNNQLATNYKANCPMMGWAYDPAALANPTNISFVSPVNLGTGAFAMTAGATIPNSSLRINSLRLQNVADNATWTSGGINMRAHSARIYVSYEKVGQILGSKTTKESILAMNVTRNTATNAILDCNISGESSAGPDASQQACMDSGGTWDAAATPKCTLLSSADVCVDSGGTWNAAATPPCQLGATSQSCIDIGGTWNAAATPKCQMLTSQTMCAESGGTWNAAAVSPAPKCELTNPAQTCADTGGTWNAAATPKCALPTTTAAQVCSDSGGTWNAAATPPCDLPGADSEQACIDSGGSWNASATPKCGSNECKFFGSYAQPPAGASADAGYVNPYTGGYTCPTTPTGIVAYKQGLITTSASCGKSCFDVDYSASYSCYKCGSNAIPPPPPPPPDPCASIGGCDPYVQYCVPTGPTTGYCEDVYYGNPYL